MMVNKLRHLALASVAVAGLAFGFSTQAAQAQTTVIYNDMYDAFNPASSLAFNQTSTWAYAVYDINEWGAGVQFAGTERNLASASFIMSNFDGWDTNGPGVVNRGYALDLTLRIYDVNDTSTPLHEVTQNFDISARLLPDPANGIGNGTNHLITFDLTGENITVPNEIVWTVENPWVNGEPSASLNIAAVDDEATPATTVGSFAGGGPTSYYGGADGMFSFGGSTPFSCFEAVSATGSGGCDLSTTYTQFVATRTAAIPEPATWAMMLAGFGLAGLRLKRRRAA